MEGGTYNCTRNFFKKAFIHAYPKFTPHFPGNLVFKAQAYEHYPIFIDLDIDLEHSADAPSNDRYLEFMYQCVDFLKVPCEVVMTRRIAPYKKKGKWHTGAHIYLLADFTLEQSQNLRTEALASGWIQQCFPSATNPPEEVFDQHLSERKNGLIIIGSRKPKVTCGPHFIFYNSQYNGELEDADFKKFGWQFSEPEVYAKLFLRIYRFIWAGVKPKQVVAKKPKIEQDVKQPVPVVSEPVSVTASKFNLPDFLRVTAGHRPNNAEYIQLLVFFVGQGLDPDDTCRQTNAAWGEVERPSETSDFMRNVTEFGVGKGTVVDYLRKHAVTDWSDLQIFGEREGIRHVNELRRFFASRGAFDRLEVENAMLEVFNIVTGAGNQLFVYQEEHLDDRGEKLTSTVTTQTTPFQQKADRYTQLKPSTKDLEKAKGKAQKPKMPNMKTCDDVDTHMADYRTALAKYERIKSCSDPKELSELLELETKGVKMGSILTNLLFTGRFREFHSHCYTPYLLQDPTPADRFNCFTGFSLAKHLHETTTVEIQKTAIYEWLFVCWANRELDKYVWLLLYLAHKIQRPHIKIKKC